MKAVTLLLEPSPRSFAPRVLEELLSALGALGLSAVREQPGSYRIEHPTLGRLQLDAEEEGGELRRLRLVPAGRPARAALLAFTGEVALALNWQVVDEERGTRLQPRQLAAASGGFDRVLGRSRAALTAIGATLAVVGGLTWRAQGGGESVWLVLALVGLCLYFGLRASAWIGSRLRRPHSER